MEYKSEKDILILYPKGEIDHHTAGNIRNQSDELIIRMKPKKLIMDMSGITFSDSSGIAVAIGRYKLMKSIGGSMEIVNAPPIVKKIFTISGLSKMFNIN